METVTCPYCDEECDIERDGERFTEDDGSDDLECSHCGKNFIVQTLISFNYIGEKCPCLNGEKHDWQQVIGHPMEILKGKERCSYCGEERDTYTPEERKKAYKDYTDYLGRKHDERLLTK